MLAASWVTYHATALLPTEDPSTPPARPATDAARPVTSPENARRLRLTAMVFLQLRPAQELHRQLPPPP